MSITIIATEFHKDISEEMIEAAIGELTRLGIKNFNVVKVSGCFEVPLTAQKILTKKSTEGLVVLGYIEKGETLHGEVMGYVVYDKLFDLGLKYKKPIGFGIIGPGATLEQAKVRTQSAAKGAVQALSESLEVLKNI